MNSKFFKSKLVLCGSSYKRWSLFTRAFSSLSEERIVRSPAPFLELPNGNFTKTVLKNVDKHWMNTALECSQTGQKFSYAELVDQMARWSDYLKHIGIGKGDIISIISPNCIQFPPLIYGTASAGAAFSPINAKFTPDEIRRMLQMTNAKTLIFSKEMETTVTKALKENITDYRLLCIGKPQELKAENVDDILYSDKSIPLNPLEMDGSETLYIPFSSGTTGPPKAATTSHNALVANILMYTNPYHDVLWKPEGTTQNVQMGMLPFFHIYGFQAILSTGIYSGAKTIIVPNFSPENFINVIIKYKITYLHSVPTLLNLLNYSPHCTSETMGHINSVVCGAAPVLKSSVEFFRKKLQKDICFYEGYGMTEVGITNLSPKRFQRPVGCGHLLSNVEAKVISTETGELLGPNEIGEICFKSPAVMQGYLNNPTATNEFIKNGWGHTGDLGYYDNDEFFYVVDRTKDLIKVHGMQVSPSEIEEELQKHPYVAECSVIGVPNDQTGEAPFAFVIPKQEVSELELQSFLKDKLAKHKQLRGGIRFVDTLPKSDTGKVLRRQLRTMV